MTGRDPAEPHRAATPLELLVDLCFVVAVARAATLLHDGLATDNVRHAVAGYLVVFFAIWLAWLNFTWFASAYDTDDVPYRLLTLLQIVGILILASGIGTAFDGDFTAVTIGYVVMRVGLTLQWIRAGLSDRVHGKNAFRYAIALTVIQSGWILALFVPADLRYFTFVALAIAELAGPYWAEHTGSMTSWHPGHIAERYGLFTIIVLGECVLSAFIAIDAARSSAHGISFDLAILAGVGLVCMFGIWWSYFRISADEMLATRPSKAFAWGYGHYVLFASIAAFGAGVATIAALSGGHEPTDAGPSDHGDTVHGLSELGQGLVVAVPVAVTLFLLAAMRPLLQGRPSRLDIVAYASGPLVLVAGALAGSVGVNASLGLIAVLVIARVIYDEAIVSSANRG